MLGSLCLKATTYTWDGGGTNNNWSTANNWAGNSTPTSNADVVFAGTLRLNVTSQWGTNLNSITFASGAGAFTISGGGYSLGAGGITNNSSNTETINDQISLSANQTWTAASGSIVTGTSYFNANSHNLTLAGSHDITMGGQVANVATLSLTGSGNRTFTSTSTLSATTLNVSNTGTNTFAGQVNTTTINLSSGTSNFTNTGTSAQAGSGGLNISGNANATFSGQVAGGSGGINVSSSGDVTFNGNITGGNLTLNGTGTTTIHGASNNISTTTVNNGTLIMDSSGTSTNGNLIVNSGGTVIMAGDNQVPAWTNITLNEGSTLLLGDTTQTITNLTITGDSVIDFGDGGSALNISSITVTNDAILTIVNWNSAVDTFISSGNATSQAVQVYYPDTGTTGTYTSGSGTITPGGTPVPEPATYGFLLMGSGVALAFCFRRRQGRNPRALR